MPFDHAPYDAALQHLDQELFAIRTGRANPALVENISVKAYDSNLPLQQLASVSVSDARTLVIQPWDANVLKDIERALQQADLGMSPVNDGAVIRLVMPTLTEERRQEYLKILHTKLEEARVSVRKIREDAIRNLRDQKRDGKISEDDLFAQQKELQKMVDDYMNRIADKGRLKEKELVTV